MSFFRQTAPAKPLAIVAGGGESILEILYRHGFRVREAWSTRGVMEALQEKPALMVLDKDSLASAPDLPPEVLESALVSARQDGLGVFSPEQFLAESQQLVSLSQESSPRRIRARFLPPRTALFTHYAGGTGKTTLALGAARSFRQASGLPCAVLEFGLGGSALQARLGGRLPSLYNRVTQESEPGRWEGVDLYPLDGRESQVLALDPRLPAALTKITQAHTLTVLDAHPGSPLWLQALELSSDIFVVASPRVDALAQTESLLHEIREVRGGLENPPRLHLVLNMTRSWGDRLGSQAAVQLPYDERKAERLDASLATPLLNLLYPGWQDLRKGGQA